MSPSAARAADPADDSVLRFPPTPSASVAGPTLQEAKHQRRVEPNRLAEGAPNILIILLDDVGFGLADTFGGEIHTPTLTRLAQDGVSFLLPLVLGMVVRRLFPALAERIGNRLMVAGLVLTACALGLLILHILLIARWSGVATLAGLIAISLAIGHLLGGPAEDDRTALAIACATRHIGIAVLVAASVPGPRTSVLVAFYTVMSAVISIPYLRWCRVSVCRVRPRGPGELRGSPSN
jgi:hypothetical protein